MVTIAEGYMDIKSQTVKKMQVENKDDPDGFKREILEYWRNKNPDDQVQRLAALLYKASEEHGLVDLQKVLPILDVSERDAYLGTLPKVTEEEFSALAQSLRPWTQRAMKIEVAPWIRDYLVDMRELYCKLTLEKLTYKPFGKSKTKIENYSDLFDEKAEVPNKILAKGDPGMGKTTLSKKIAWDWAKNDFKKVSIVLFLLLKSVQPDESLEKASLEQMPELVGLGITEAKLESFIEHFGRRCLLICDGLDEQAKGSNRNVQKVLRHEKYLNCNVFLTSRPHSSRGIQRYFDTIVSVEGFTRAEAKKFALCVVLDEEKVEQILDFNPAGSKQEVALFQCPILLSFICILVREKALDLSDRTMATGEIYTRMIQCLYRKFTVRKHIEYDGMEFINILRLVGKLAWETLLSDDPLFTRSRVEEEIGEDVFDYGFLIGNEDLIGSVNADIWITFAHRSILEFFGAFFFVLQLIQGRDIDDLLGDSPEDPIFMKNPLFLHFIFWFLSRKCSDDYFPLGNIDKAGKVLDSYIYSRVHRMLGSVELTAEFPAIDFQSALQTNDHINLGHFGRMLERFRKMKYLVIPPDDSKGWILNRILTTCRALKVMDPGESEESWKCVWPDFSLIDENNTGILLSDKAYRRGVLKDLCKIAVQSNRQLVVYMYVNEGQTIDISNVLRLGIEKLIIGATQAGTKVTCTGDIIPCPMLTELSVIGQGQLCNHMMRAISKTLREGKLPRLKNLSIVGMKIKGQLKNLFEGQTIEAKLTHLNLCNSDLMKNDLQALCFASNSEFLRNLASLHFADGHFVLRPRRDIFAQNWVNLVTLSVKLTKSGFQELMQAITHSSLTNLRKLNLFMLPNEMCDLGKMQSDQLPFLEHLCVQRCITSKNNLKHVSRMVTHWTLHTLDISHSQGITGELSTLISQDLTSLKNLILCDCQLNDKDMNCLAQANDEGQLSNLESLDVSENGHLIETFGSISSKWERLQKLKINSSQSIMGSKH